MSLGPTEIILVIVVLLLLFGGRKIPELMKGLGQGMKEFRKASRIDDEVVDNNKAESKKE
jgi:sec-independent protein translocase protein TatA